jgi:hypothetical protein
MMKTSRACWILVFLVGLPAVLCAQNQKGSWSDLNSLRAGQGVEVIESSMKSHRGEFVMVTDEFLTMKEHGADVSVKRADVVRVSISSGPKRGAHALIGLVVGAGVGAAVGAIAGSSGSKTGSIGFETPAIGALVGLAIGGPSGAALGAVVPAHATIYRLAPAAPHAAPPTVNAAGIANR